jgi:hypothetical protein
MAKIACVLYEDPITDTHPPTRGTAQARYAAGTREVLECFRSGRLMRDEYLIVQGDGLAGAGAVSYTSRRSVP